jgi:hypothetical protein
MDILLSTTYFGPIQFYTKLISTESIILERFEHYPKQTYRNRCIIYGANGPQTLTVPVTRGSELKIYTKDVRVDYSMNWPKIHFKAMESAYRCAPFYLYYMDDIAPFFEKKYTFLYDFNLEIIHKIAEILNLPISIKESSDYIKQSRPNNNDFRDTIHPKQRMHRDDQHFSPPIYQQVFEPKLGFVANLSIIDLIFNTGTEALALLRASII